MRKPQMPQSEVEVVTATHEMQYAAGLVHIERHAQPRRQLLNQGAVGSDHLGRTNDAGSAAGPPVFPVPGHAPVSRADPYNRGDVLAGTSYYRRAQQQTKPGDEAAENAGADDFKFTDVVNCDRRIRKPGAYCRRQTSPGGLPQQTLD